MSKTRNKEQTAVPIELCIFSVLALHGFKRGRDYTLSRGQLYLKDIDKKNQVIKILRDSCPEKHYYWETPRMLRWF